MEKRIGHRRMAKLVAASVIGLAGVGASQADASLIIDVRVAGALPGTGKSIQINPGEVVQMKVWAQIAGADANVGIGNDEVQNAFGNFVSTGGLLGNLSTSLSTGFAGLIGNFAASGSQVGAVQDLDGDGDLDIGTPMTGPERDITEFFNARANARQNPQQAAGFDPNIARVFGNSSEILLANLTFTAAADASGETLINFVNRVTAAGGPDSAAAVWTEDGVNSNPTVAGAVFTNGAPVQIVVPEPTSLALAGLAGLGFLARRRTAK